MVSADPEILRKRHLTSAIETLAWRDMVAASSPLLICIKPARQRTVNVGDDPTAEPFRSTRCIERGASAAESRQ